MDVSKPVPRTEESIDGENLIQTVVALTGLPADWVSDEIRPVITEQGMRPESLTMDQLREVMLKYLETFQHEMDGQDSGELAQADLN